MVQRPNESGGAAISAAPVTSDRTLALARPSSFTVLVQGAAACLAPGTTIGVGSTPLVLVGGMRLQQTTSPEIAGRTSTKEVIRP